MPKTWSFKQKQTISFTTNSSFLRRVQAGNEEAWKEFHLKYAGMIHHIGKKHHLTPEECDELFQDVMVVFWKKLDQFLYDRTRGMFRSYLAKIAHFLILRTKQRKQRAERADQLAELIYPEYVDELYMEEWRDYILDQALEELKQSVDTETFEIFYMSVFQNRPVEEITSVTRRTANNVYIIRSRCLKKLKKIISAYKEFEENESGPNSQRNRSEN